jgi:hypothetical protein
MSQHKDIQTMRFRQSISVLLILLGVLFIWRTYQRWTLPILAPYLVPQFFWPPIIAFGIPLILVGSYLVCFPYRLWQGRARPFFVYTIVLVGMSCLLVFMQASPPRIVGLDGVTNVLEASDGQPFVITDPYYDQLNGGFMRVATLVLGLPMWVVFLLAKRRDRVISAE